MKNPRLREEDGGLSKVRVHSSWVHHQDVELTSWLCGQCCIMFPAGQSLRLDQYSWAMGQHTEICWWKHTEMEKMVQMGAIWLRWPSTNLLNQLFSMLRELSSMSRQLSSVSRQLFSMGSLAPLYSSFSMTSAPCVFHVHNIENSSCRIFHPLSPFKGLMEPLATISPVSSFYIW